MSFEQKIDELLSRLSAREDVDWVDESRDAGDDSKVVEALAQIDAALALEPEHPGPVHLLRARILTALRRPREAREARAAALAADPSLASESP